MRPQQNNKSVATQVADFLLKYWMVIIPLIILLPVAYKWLKYQLKSITEQGEEDRKDRDFRNNRNQDIYRENCLAAIHEFEQNGGVLHRSADDIMNAARSIAHHLGIVYSDTDNWWSWLDPRGWTENDRATADLILEFQDDFFVLGECYYFATRSRNLIDDAIKYLDRRQHERLNDAGFGFISF